MAGITLLARLEARKIPIGIKVLIPLAPLAPALFFVLNEDFNVIIKQKYLRLYFKKIPMVWGRQITKQKGHIAWKVGVDIHV